MAILTGLDIINRACARIGIDPLQSLEEETIGGQAAELIYTGLVEFCLGVYNFSFSREMRQLSLLTNQTAVDGWKHVFALPAERQGAPLRFTDDATDPDRQFNRVALRGDLVFADVNPLFAEIKIIPPVPRWSGTFRQTVTTAMAAHLALAQASDSNLAQTLHQEAFGTPAQNHRGGYMGAAIQEDARATRPRRLDTHNNPFVQAWVS